jgi:hypothetical protein
MSGTRPQTWGAWGWGWRGEAGALSRSSVGVTAFAGPIGGTDWGSVTRGIRTRPHARPHARTHARSHRHTVTSAAVGRMPGGQAMQAARAAAAWAEMPRGSQLDSYVYLRGLQQRTFFALMHEHATEVLSIIYTPTGRSSWGRGFGRPAWHDPCHRCGAHAHGATHLLHACCCPCPALPKMPRPMSCHAPPRPLSP